MLYSAIWNSRIKNKQTALGTTTTKGSAKTPHCANCTVILIGNSIHHLFVTVFELFRRVILDMMTKYHCESYRFLTGCCTLHRWYFLHSFPSTWTSDCSGQLLRYTYCRDWSSSRKFALQVARGLDRRTCELVRRHHRGCLRRNRGRRSRRREIGFVPVRKETVQRNNK